MIRQECIDELAAELGLKERISAITERAMRGEIAFEPALRERVALLNGLPVSAIDTVLSNRIHADARRPHAGADHEGERRLLRAGLRRLHRISPGPSPT
jgi:phosphoserine phosphatase